MWGWFSLDSHSLWASSLSYDSGKLHLPAGVHLKPAVSLLWLCAPRTAVEIIIIFRTLQSTTALFRTSLSFWLENKFWPQPHHYPNFPNRCWARWKIMFTCMLSLPRWAENPWWDWEEASSWSSSTRWDSRPSGGQSWKNKTAFMALIYQRSFATLDVIILPLGLAGSAVCFSLSSSSSSHCFLSRSASRRNEKTTRVKKTPKFLPWNRH